MQKDSKQKKSKDKVNSHVQMPKSILRKFEDNHFFHYYDVKKGIIGNKGNAKSINTEFGYYSTTMERLLNQKIENPFINSANKIISCLNKNQEFSITPKEYHAIYSYFYALIARSPKLFSISTQNAISFHLLNIPIQFQHDIIVDTAFGIGKNDYYENDYFISFLINKTTMPLVLPIRGMYTVLTKNSPVIVMPIHPSYAIILVHNDLQNEFLLNNQNYPMYIDNPRIIFDFNLSAFKKQCDDEWGYVVSSDKALLEELRQEYETVSD